ncbi:MAG: hypothetical protein ACI8WB_005997 [Phenylobacterium sp.]|jgi:hypothetical protein
MKITEGRKSATPASEKATNNPNAKAITALDNLEKESMPTVEAFLQHIPAFSFVLLGLYGASLKSFIEISTTNPLIQQHLILAKILLLAPILTLFGGLILPLIGLFPRRFEADLNAIEQAIERNLVMKRKFAKLGVVAMVMSFILISTVFSLLIITI